MSALTETKFNISVSARIKPLSKQEIENLSESENINSPFVGDTNEDWNNHRICVLSNTGNVKVFDKFKHVVVPDCNQETTFSLLMPNLIENFLNGKNCTVIAYGQTGMGKTHTMLGPPGCLTEASLAFSSQEENGKIPNDWGLFPRALMTVLQKLEGIDFSMTATAVEVYFNNVYDLLNSRKIVQINSVSSIKKKLFPGGIKDQNNGRLPYNKDRFGNFVGETELKKRQKQKPETQQNSSSKMNDFTPIGNQQRQISTSLDIAHFARSIEATRISMGHNLNDRSSRSHCIINVSLSQKLSQDSGNVFTSKFIFVDLAGSERIAKSQSKGARKEEAANINTSLTALGRTIEALAKNDEKSYVPYRDSVLTMLLKESLSGSTKTSMIICVSENPFHNEETIASLRFGERTALVKTKSSISQNSEENISQNLSVLKTNILQVKLILDDFKKRGLAGGLNPDFPKATQQSFIDNKMNLEKSVKYAENLKQQLSELGTKSSKEYQEKESKRQEVLAQCVILEGIVTRMIFSKLWVPPNVKFIQKKAELKELVAQFKHFLKLDGKEQELLSKDPEIKELLSDEDENGIDNDTYMYKSLAKSRFLSMGTK